MMRLQEWFSEKVLRGGRKADGAVSENELGLGLEPGGAHYRAYVGPPEDYDLVAAMSFGLLSALGLRGRHVLLDVGCGSLRLGRLLIPFLNRGHYHGLEPNRWLLDEGVAKEVGRDLVGIKQPVFHVTERIADVGAAAHFDFVIAQSIFSHCGHRLLDEHLQAISGALKPGGALLATFLTGDEDTDQQEWVYPGCVLFRQETMEAAAKRHGFRFFMLDWAHPRQKWALFAKPDFDVDWLIGRSLGWNTWLNHGPK